MNLLCGWNGAEFGAFISAGTIENVESTLRLTLARRYIEDDDPRKRLSLLKHASSIVDVHPPWKNL